MMAKMFYTLEEAAAKLGTSEDEVREMAKSGRIQEFRDRDKLMFKVDQVDLIAAGESGAEEDLGLDLEPSATEEHGDEGLPLESSDESGIGLDMGDPAGAESSADTGGGSGIALEPLDGSGDGSGLGSGLGAGMGSGVGSGIDLGGESSTGSGTGPGLLGDSGGSSVGIDSVGDSAERSGISIFEADELETADPSAVTQMTDEPGDLTLDSVGSGSGLMDLTRESDDTSLGAEFLDEVYPGEEGGEEGGGGLFEGGDDEATPAAAGPAVIAAEPYDGAGSGLVGGLSLAMVAALAVSIAVVGTALVGAGAANPVAGLGSQLADQIMIVAGALAGFAVIAAVVGLVLGKRSE
jgi:hypothetical protein